MSFPKTLKTWVFCKTSCIFCGKNEILQIRRGDEITENRVPKGVVSWNRLFHSGYEFIRQ